MLQDVIIILYSATLVTTINGGDFVFMVDSGCDFGPLILAKKSDTNVTVTPNSCDTLFKKRDWQEPPNIAAPGVSEKNNHLLLMLDPDAANTSPGVFYFHWAVANIPGRILKDVPTPCGNNGRGNTLLQYKGPSSPKGSGQHRYVFLLYEQDDNSTIDEKPLKRAQFDLGCWMNPLSKRHPLTGPVAGTQIRIQY